MKTVEQLQSALDTYEHNLIELQKEIEDVNIWCRASDAMQEKDLFIAQVEKMKDLRKQEQEAQFRINFVKWCLKD